MKHEYHEGVKAGENFEQLARAVFQAPKVAVPKKQPKVKPKRRKTTGSDIDELEARHAGCILLQTNRSGPHEVLLARRVFERANQAWGGSLSLS
jgi:hypothetical protein